MLVAEGRKKGKNATRSSEYQTCSDSEEDDKEALHIAEESS